MPCCAAAFEHVEQRRDVGVDSAAEVLQIDQDGVERAHRLAGWPAMFSVEAEDGNSVGRVGEVGRLHHIVLEIAADAVLRPEHRRNLEAGRDQRVEAVGEVLRYRCRVSEQRDALAFERAAKLRVGEEAIDTEKGHQRCLGQLRGEAIGRVEIGLAGRMRERPVGLGAVLLLENGREVQVPLQSRVDSDRRAQRPPSEIVLDPDVRRRGDVGVAHSFAIAGKVVGGPLPGRGEVPLAVGVVTCVTEEGLETGRLPKLIRPTGFGGRGNDEA